MPDYKGSSLIQIKTMLQEKGPQALQTFLDSLTPAERTQFHAIVPATWVPITLAQRFVENAAAVLFPKDPQAFSKIGEARAAGMLTGLYRAFFSILSPEIIVDNSYRLWPVLHNRGTASVERRPQEKKATFTVTGYPELPNCFRHMMTGFILGCMALGKAKNVTVRLVETDPNRLQWTGSWE